MWASENLTKPDLQKTLENLKSNTTKYYFLISTPIKTRLFNSSLALRYTVINHLIKTIQMQNRVRMNTWLPLMRSCVTVPGKWGDKATIKACTIISKEQA
jgi:hypothetical protein